MGIWFRTQNGNNLVLCHDISVAGKDVTGKYFVADDYFALLGTYSTKKRALEVLERLETHINNYDWSIQHGDYAAKVFQMPKE